MSDIFPKIHVTEACEPESAYLITPCPFECEDHKNGIHDAVLIKFGSDPSSRP